MATGRQETRMAFLAPLRMLRSLFPPSKVKPLHNHYAILMTIAILLTIDIGLRNGHFSDKKNRMESFEQSSHLPDVIIYRRTKKTGSSSMLEEILRETSSNGYIPLYHAGPRMKLVVRAEGLKRHPGRLFVAEHNGVTRKDTRGRKSIIIDTFVDGYKQMTSHCRFVEKHKVRHCDEELLDCLRGPARSERYFRWAFQKREEDDTFIGIPLSSEHPALSTTAFRHIFPSAVLDVKHTNSAGSSCPEDARIRAVYQRNYKELEQQIDELRKRLLALSGYPFISRTSNVTVSEMLDVAERLEREKYLREENLVFGIHSKSRQVSHAHILLKRGEKVWRRDANDEIRLISQWS